MTKKVIAYQKFIRQTPRKLRLVADMIRNLPLEDALIQLKVSNKRGAEVIEKVLKQAKANAINVGLRVSSLSIASIQIQEGATYKRWNPVSRGRAHSIMKRTSHIKIEVGGNDEPVKPVVAKKSTPKVSKSEKKKDQKGKGK